MTENNQEKEFHNSGDGWGFQRLVKRYFGTPEEIAKIEAEDEELERSNNSEQ